MRSPGLSFLVRLILLNCIAQSLAVTTALAESQPSTNSSDANDYIITGHVKDLDGHAITGAAIEWGSDKEPFSRRQHVVTDKDGAYRFVIKEIGDDDHFAASAPGFATELRQTTFEPGEQIRDFILRAMPQNEHVVGGTVIDEKGIPVAGARVEALTAMRGVMSSFSMPTGRDHFPGPDRVAITDDQGRFRIADLPTDQVQLTVQAKHRYVNDDNYPVSDSVKIKMFGSGKPGVVQGRIVDASTNKPPQNIRDIRIVARYSTLSRRCSDDDGHFRLSGEPTLGDVYYVYVYAKGYAATGAKIQAVSPDSEDFKQVELTPAATLKGKLVDAKTNEPVKRAKLVYGISEGRSYIAWSDLKSYADGRHPLKFVQHVMSNHAGDFWFAEPKDSRGMIVALIPGYQRIILKPIDRQINAETGELVIRLKPECNITGVVLQNGKPLANVSVSVSTPANDPAGRDPSQMPESVHTDAQGKYTYGCLPPGRQQVHCDSYTRVITVGDGETKTVNLGEDLGTIQIHGLAPPLSWVEAYPDFEWDYRRLATKANVAGEYELRGLKPGKYRLRMYSGFNNGVRGPRNNIETAIDQDGQEINLRPIPPVQPKIQAAGKEE
jgi:protocatechuate 3,4-dioxygenase beta subunit